MTPQLNPGESILFQSPAERVSRSHLTSRRGRLWLTEQRLIFESLALLQRGEESYPLTAIASVEPYRALGVIPNRIAVYLADGREFNFVVIDQQGWLTAIEAARDQTGAAPAAYPRPAAAQPATGVDTVRAFKRVWLIAVVLIASAGVVIVGAGCCLTVVFPLLAAYGQ